MARVTGLIHDENGTPITGATVRAFDKDMRSEQLLGEVVSDAGHYTIEYDADQYARAEMKTADLIVRAFDEAGNQRAESDVIFNASEEEQVNLTFEPPPPEERRDLSELEQLQEALEPIREEVPYADFTEEDVRFLVEELSRRGFGAGAILERAQLRRRLNCLRGAGQLERETEVLLAAFYGWCRQGLPTDLDALLDISTSPLRKALETAIAEKIIADITEQIPDILDQIEGLRFQRGRLVSHRFVVQLVDDETDRPLTGHNISAVDLEAEPDEQDGGSAMTDGQGLAALGFVLPGDAPEDATRRLGITIRENGRIVADEIEIAAHADQEEVAEIRVQVREDEDGQVAIEEVAPAGLAARLRQRGIASLGELLNHPDLVDEDEPEELERARAHARFAVLAPELDGDQREALIEAGHGSLLDVAGTSRAAFVGDFSDTFGGEAEPYLNRYAAIRTSKVFHQIAGSAWLTADANPDDEPDPDIPTGVGEILSRFKKCGCKDCQSAVSPAAYLSHLLGWTLDHVKDGNAPITFGQLEDELHQPFRDMPAACGAVEEQVRQVRIAVETLWRFNGLRDIPMLNMPPSFRDAYRPLCNQLYRGILANLGVSYDQLRLARLHQDDAVSEDDALDPGQQVVADLLGIEVARLGELFFDIEQAPTIVSEPNLQRLFGFADTRSDPFERSAGRPDLINWQRERLAGIWESLDWPSDAYSGEGRLPFVDPEIIDETYLRTPLDANPAFDLLVARRGLLADHRQTLVDADPLQNGLDQLLESELGLPTDELRTHFAALGSDAEPEDIAQAHATIVSLNLTPAGFIHLMQIDARFENGEPIGATDDEITANLDAVFDVLSSAFRRGQFSDWVGEEDALGVDLGPELFWLPLEPGPAPNPWLATAAERAAWEEALAERERPPIIDPDQIARRHLRIFGLALSPFVPPGTLPDVEMPPLAALELWQERRAWVDERLEVLQEAREGQPTPLDGLQAMLEASAMGAGLELFEELATLEAEGGDLEPRLAQLSLTLPEYRFLADIHQLAVDEATIAGHEWEQVAAILVQAEKRREFPEWRQAEQDAGITLRPSRFRIPEEVPPTNDSSHRWLHDPLAYQRWEASLQARYDQLRTLEEALANAVGEAEAAVLPLLRNLLIMESVAPGDSLAEKADWLDRRLLMDMRMDGCHMTTRVSQAIETIQRFIRGIYTQEHLELMQHLTLDGVEDYEEEWPVLGSYATCRAFMLAFLNPENLLHLARDEMQSYGFTRLKNKLPSRVEPRDACAAVDEYADYFRDVCHLEVQASCQVLTRGSRTTDCGATTSAFFVRGHLFAVARTSGKVYTATFNPSSPRDLAESWRPVDKVGSVEQIIGAVPHTTPDQKRYIVLFVKVLEAGDHKLQFLRYDLDELKWIKPRPLKLPFDNNRDFTAAAIQKRVGPVRADQEDFHPSLDFPTILAVQARNGLIYLSRLDPDADGWWSEGWFPLYGPSTGETFGAELLALVQRTKSEYVILGQRPGRKGIYYRPLFLQMPGRDDLSWRLITTEGPYRGALAMPLTRNVFVFYGESETKYRVLEPARDFLSFDDSPHDFSDSIFNFNWKWLEALVGVSLKDYKFPNLNPSFFVPKNTTPFIDQENQPFNPIDPPEWEEVDEYYFGGFTGNLLELLTLEPADFELIVREPVGLLPNDGGPVFEVKDHKDFYMVQLQAAGVKEFLAFIEDIEKVDYTDKNLGFWKLADHYIRHLSKGGLSLSELIERFLYNIIRDTTTHYSGGVNIGNQDIVFRKRDTSSGEVSGSHQFLSSRRRLPPSGGDGYLIRGPSANQAIALSRGRGSFITKLHRAGQALEAPTLHRITPNGDGPFDLVPLTTQKDLQLRRAEIRSMYKGPPNLEDAPAWVRSYLKEAYNLVPVYLGYQLQRDGYFEEALEWYRQVYDYTQTGRRRKIDYLLRKERSLSYSYADAEAWLDDASNVHAIAATRKNTYTRQVLLIIIRCLLDYADQLFSHDNVTDNARARELYTLALKLLDSRVLRRGKSGCSDVIGSLEIEVAEAQTWPIGQFKVALAQIDDPQRRVAIKDSLVAIGHDTAVPAVERLGRMRETLASALGELPPPKTMQAVRDDGQQTFRTLENHYLTHRPTRDLLKRVQIESFQAGRGALAAVAGTSEAQLRREPLPWLRLARPGDTEDGNGARPVDPALFDPVHLRREDVVRQIREAAPMESLAAAIPGGFAVSSGISFDFCIPQNPVINALRARAENNLAKLRQCRNIAGMLRQVDPYGAPTGLGSGMVSPDGTIFSGIVQAPSTPYRYAALSARAKELADRAGQMEAGYQAALERAEQEALTVLQAEQGVELASAQVTLQDLRLNQANNELGLAQLQRDSAAYREQTYAGWIAAGKNEHEKQMLAAYSVAADARKQAARASAAAAVAQTVAQAAGAWSLHKLADFATGIAATQTAALAASAAATLAAATFQERAIEAEARAQSASFEASFERRNDEWQLQQGLAALDVQIGDQQILLAQDQIAIVEQERAIAVMAQTHALDVLEYLANKDFTEEMYRWIASVLQDVYSFFLWEATVTARLAEAQLAFERQTAPLKVIQSDYWDAPADGGGGASKGVGVDRLGLTGSARLLKDIYQLDGYAFETRRRKQRLTLTLDLAEMFPVEFQRFRETGVLVFETPTSLIQRQFPGYYLCLIQQVSTSIVALIPPTRGVRASLTSAGISRVVVGGDIFQPVTIRNLPERMALTSPTTSSGSVIELQPDAQSLQRPFEGSGFDTLWELRMPKAANPFDYNTMATVLVTLEMTALHSFDYERQVIEDMDRHVSANRAFYFRQEFSDAWYDLHNPEQTDTPMSVRFETRRDDFPPNLENLRIEHVLLYFIGAGDESGEISVERFTFSEQDSSGVVGGGATTIDGVISTRRGNGTGWLPMIGQSPFGEWELALPDTPEIRARFENEECEDILLVITYGGLTPEWPV